MGKLEIMDNCMAPEEDIYIQYSGPDPWSIVKKIHGGIRPYFHVSSVGMSNYDFRWDRLSPDKVEFFSKWWVKKGLSNQSTMKVDIKVQGYQQKSTNMGKFSIRMRVHLLTTFEGWSVFLRPLYMMYSYLFYNKVKRDMINRCRDFGMGFRNELKSQFGIKETSYGSRGVGSA